MSLLAHGQAIAHASRSQSVWLALEQSLQALMPVAGIHSFVMSDAQLLACVHGDAARLGAAQAYWRSGGMATPEQNTLLLYLKDEHKPIGVLCVDFTQPLEQDWQSAVEVLAAFAVVGWQMRAETPKPPEQTRLISMGEFALALSHQLNNPLTTIVADTEMLLSQLGDADAHTPTLQAIARSGRRAAEVVHRLMAIGQPNSMDETLYAMSIAQSVRGVLSRLKPLLSAAGVQHELHIQEGLPSVWTLPNMLNELWVNLITNAIDAAKDNPHPRIGIECVWAGGQAPLTVRIWDNGRGVSPDERERIFLPFYTTKDVMERMGLGLYICQQIVEHLHGRLRVDAREGGGACFIVELPVERG